jgi:cell division protein FtsA
MFGKNKQSDYIVGIDLGTHTTRAILTMHKKENNTYSEIVAVAACESKGLRNGYITHLDSAKECVLTLVSQLKEQSHTDIKKVNVSIGGISVSSVLSNGECVITRSDAIVTELDIQKAIEEAEKKLDLTNREILHTIPILYKIDSKEVLGRPIGMRGNRIEIRVFFVICLAQHLSDVIDLFTEIGIEVENIVASPIAASCIALTESQKQNGVMLANIGAETVSVIVYERGLPLALQVFPIGGSDFTKDIALGLKIGVEEAELIKTGKSIGSYSERKLSEIIEARLRDIFELLEKFLKKINRDALLPAGIIITGGGSHISQIESLARTSLRLPTRVGIPEHLLQQKPRIRDVSWIVSYGLCNFNYKDYTFNKIKNKSNNKNITNKIKNFFHDLMP